MAIKKSNLYSSVCGSCDELRGGIAERYTTLPKLTEEVAVLAARVDEHLKKMGAIWN
jgi:hypothetical protein